MSLTIRQCRAGDAAAMCDLLNAIIARGGTTAHRQPFDPARMTSHYIDASDSISCVAAFDDAHLLGFQALAHADPDGSGPDALPPGWAVIASFVAESHQGRGIGRALFAATRSAALHAGIVAIDATIRRENKAGQGYYAGLGFREWREGPETVSKRFDLTP